MEKKITVTFIRCGMSYGASQGRYVGTIDEPLLEESKRYLVERREAGIYPRVARVYSSVQTRCLETAYIIYPRIPAIATPELRAFEYGEYAGRTYFELVSDERFARDARSRGVIEYPGGEDTYAFQARTGKAFQNILTEIDGTNVTTVAIISHKETILPILRRFSIPRSNYADYPLEPGGGVTVSYDSATGIGKIASFF